jgi:Fur family ferric uptake transcriptional regulator
VHFICSICGKATCLNDVQVPAVKLPRGYHADQVSLVVNGTCPNCA